MEAVNEADDGDRYSRLADAYASDDELEVGA